MKPTLSGFINNIINNAGGVAQNLIGTPGRIYKAAMDSSSENLSNQQSDINSGTNPLVASAKSAYSNLVFPITKVLAPMVKGYAQNLNTDFGSPVSVQNGSVNLKAPDINAAATNFYQNPVSTALDVLPLVSEAKAALGSKASKLSGVAPATEAEAGIVSPFKSVAEGAELPKVQSLRDMPPPKVPDVAAQTAMKGYTIPAGLDIDVGKIGKYIVNDKPNLNLNQPFLSTVENIKQAVLKDATDKGILIPTDEALTSGTKAIDSIPGLPGGKQAIKYRTELSAYFPKPAQIGSSSPMDTYSSIKNLETQGYSYLDSGTDAYGKITNQVDYKLGKVYIDTAKKLESQLDSKISGADIVGQYTQSPAILDQVKQFSPKVAERLQNNVQNWSDLRALQAPYVSMDRVMSYTNKAGHTAFANLSGGATRAVTGGVGTAVGGALGGLPGAVVGSAVGTFAEPLISNMANKMLPGVMAKGGQIINDISKGAQATGNALKFGVPLAGGLKVGSSLTDNPSVTAPLDNFGVNKNNDNTVKNNTSYDAHGSIIAGQSNSSIKPDPTTGKIELPQAPPEGSNTRKYMSGADYQAGLAALAKQYPAGAADPAYTVAKTQLDSQFQIDQSQADEVFKGNNVKNFMDNATQYNADGKNLLDTFMSLPTGFWNGVKNVGSIKAYTDPNYAQQLQQIDNFNNEYASAYKSVTGQDPTDNQLLSTANSPEQAAKKYTAMMQFISGTYGKYLSPYLALTSATGAQTQHGTPTSLSPIPQPIPQTPDALPSSMLQGGSLPPFNQQF